MWTTKYLVKSTKLCLTQQNSMLSKIRLHKPNPPVTSDKIQVIIKFNKKIGPNQ